MADYVYRPPYWPRQRPQPIFGVSSNNPSGSGIIPVTTGVTASGTVTFAGVASVPIAQPTLASAGIASIYPLSISSNSRYLVDATGSPYLLVGESAWLIFNELTTTDAQAYLDDRQSKGLNAVLVQLLSKVQSNSPNNHANDAPFTTPGDLSTPNSVYFNHVVDVINEAAKRGILVMIAPVYAGFAGASTDGWWLTLNGSSDTVVQNFGAFIGGLLKGLPNIIWVFGGDFTPPGGNTKYDKLLTGIRSAGDTHLCTSHWDQTTNSPNGILSTDFTPPTPDINSAYSWVGTTSVSKTVYTFVRNAYGLGTTRPVGVIECVYQNNTAQGGTSKTTRAQAWAAILEGGFWQISGNEAIWQFSSTNGNVPSQAQGWGDWHTHLNDGGVVGMQRIASILSTRRWEKLVPDSSNLLLTSGRNTFGAANYVCAATAADKSFAIAYLPTGGTVGVDMSRLVGSVAGHWIDPFDGSSTAVTGQPFNASGTQSLTSPGSNSAGDSDWILALDATPGSDVSTVAASYRIARATYLRM